MGFSNNDIYWGACIVFHNIFTNQNYAFHWEESWVQRCDVRMYFVLLGPWNRYRCFLKDERNAMGTLHARLQIYKECIISFSLIEMRVTSFGLLTLMGVACFLLLIIVSCSDKIHSPAFTTFSSMIFGQVLESWGVCSGPLLGFGFSWSCFSAVS